MFCCCGGRVDEVAKFIRGNKREICDQWEASVLQALPDLHSLSRGALVDHLPEVLDGLADWLEGCKESAERSFAALAEGHALQRLGFGITLETLSCEYSILRQTILTSLLVVEASPDVRQSLVRLNVALDQAIWQSVRRYTGQRDEIRERFIGILAHDLRSPLNTVVLSAQALLRSENAGSLELKIAAAIVRAAARMGRMIEDLLDFARGHLGGGIPATPVPNDLGEICRSVIDEISPSQSARVIKFEAHGDLQGACDAERVKQAMTNLIENALRHGEGEVRVYASEASDRRSIVTEVKNAGQPIPPALLSTLFEPFARGEGKDGEGLGLGLFIVNQVALAHGAVCDVRSSHAEGTVFSITWPRTPLAEGPRRG